MISVSDAWKEAQRGLLVPLSDIRIEYNVTDPGVQEDAEAAGTLEEHISRADLVVNELRRDEAKYASLERNLFILDGTYRALPSTLPPADGFISSVLSGDDGTFAEIPTITISFSKVYPNTVPGVTVTWSKTYEEYARAYRVTAYNGETQVAKLEVTDNTSVISYAWVPIAGYDRIVVEILKWSLPHHRARMIEVLVGIKQIYTKKDLMGYEHSQTVDLLSAKLPKNSIVFKLDNSDNKWNPDNPQGAERYLIARQTLVVKYGLMLDGQMEWIKAGTFFMSEWKTPENGLLATFTARDRLEFCNEVYAGPTTGTLREIAAAALEQSGIDPEDYVLDVSLESVTTTFEISKTNPPTCAEILQMVANAGKCCLWQSRDAVLHLEPLNTRLTDYVIGKLGEDDLSNAYAHPEFTLTKELKSVDVNRGMGAAVNGTEGTVQSVNNDLIVDAKTANAVAEWCRDVLKDRKIVSGKFRADPRLDALDKITVVSKYGTQEVYLTEVKYSYSGAFQGTYKGRVREDG